MNSTPIQSEKTTKNNEQTIVHSQSHVWNTTLQFISSMTLKCAVDLNIPSAISEHEPTSLSDLIKRLDIPHHRAHCIPRLMRSLVHAGFFAVAPNRAATGEVSYVHTPASLHLLSHAAPFTKAMLDPAMVAPWLHLGSWIRGDHGAPTAFHLAHGMGLWAYAEGNEVFNRVFNEGMAHDAELVTGLVVDKCKAMLQGVRLLVDVGGGNGAMARALAEEFEELECVVFDLPHVVRGLERRERVEFVQGDMFEGVPHAQVLLLKSILHDYEDEDCVKILKHCKESIGKEEGGKVLVIEMVLNVMKSDYLKSAETQMFFDLQMMTIVGGKERDEKEWGEIFTRAGFTSYKITPILDFLCIIEVFP